MYCGCCGKEIAAGSAFCPECGAKVESARGTNSKGIDPNTKKHIRLIVASVAVLVIVIAGIKLVSHTQSLPSEEEIQTIANNAQNGALVASDGTWIYYNDSGLCKMKLENGTEQTVISSDIDAEHMFCIGGTLYYYNFSGYYSLDGSVGKDLGFSAFTEDCIQSDGKNFYVTGLANYEDGGVYAAKVGNTEQGTKLSDINPTSLLLQGDYLYVISHFSYIDHMPNENYGTWRIKTNGKDEMRIFDYCPKYLVFSGDKMYYTNEEKVICSANLDGSEETSFEYAIVGDGLNVSDEYIFFISFDSQTIYRMDKDGGNLIELNSDRSGSLSVVDDWIFYENQDKNNDIYKMSFDGNYNQPIY